jgi:hypothetical protein
MSKRSLILLNIFQVSGSSVPVVTSASLLVAQILISLLLEQSSGHKSHYNHIYLGCGALICGHLQYEISSVETPSYKSISKHTFPDIRIRNVFFLGGGSLKTLKVSRVCLLVCNDM